jgi:hypothetical protein
MFWLDGFVGDSVLFIFFRSGTYGFSLKLYNKSDVIKFALCSTRMSVMGIFINHCSFCTVNCLLTSWVGNQMRLHNFISIMISLCSDHHSNASEVNFKILIGINMLIFYAPFTLSPTGMRNAFFVLSSGLLKIKIQNDYFIIKILSSRI